MRHLRSKWASFCAAALMVGCLSSRAKATYIVTYAPDGSGDIVATGSGTIDTAALTLITGNTEMGAVWPDFPISGSLEVTGGTASVLVDTYSGISTGVAAFGTGGRTVASSGSGDMVGVIENLQLYVPTGYVSGTALSDTSTYAGATLASLGLTPGTYTETWGTGPTADSFTVDVSATPISSAPASAPEPRSFYSGMMALAGVGGFWAVRRRKAAKV